MPFWKITWNLGYGDSIEFVECDTQAEADQLAYEHWKEEAENQAEYRAEGPLDDPTKDEDHPDYDPGADDDTTDA